MDGVSVKAWPLLSWWRPFQRLLQSRVALPSSCVPSCAFAMFSDPVGAVPPDRYSGPVSSPPMLTQRTAQDIVRFRGSIARPWHSLSTLHRFDCSTRARLASSCAVTLVWTGFGLPLTCKATFKRFPFRCIPFLLLQASLGAIAL